MDIENRPVAASGIRIAIKDNDTEVGHAYIYLMRNDLHGQPFGLMEDVYVSEAYRGQGIGSELVKRALLGFV